MSNPCEKIPCGFDLALFLIIVGVIIYCFMEMSIGRGIIALAVGTGIFLGWIRMKPAFLLS